MTIYASIRYSLLWVSLLISVGGMGQDAEAAAGDVRDPSTFTLYGPVDDVNIADFYRASFTRIVDPSSNTNIGNFASLDLGETKATLGVSQHFNNGGVLAIKTAGSVDDGVVAIWSEKNWNTSFAFDAQYHWLGSEPVLNIWMPYGQNVGITRAVADLNEAYAKNWYDIKYDKVRQELKAQVDSLSKRVDQLRQAGGKSGDDLDRTSTLLQMKQQELKWRESNIDPVAERITLYENYKTSRDSLLHGAVASSIDVNWFSIGGGIKASKFKLYEPALPYADQINQTSYASWELRAQYSAYSRQPLEMGKFLRQNYFFTVGLASGIADNHEELATVKIEDGSSTGPDTLQRTTVKDYSVLSGKYLSDLSFVRGYLDIYKFLGKNGNVAVHVFPSMRIQQESVPLTSVGLGVVLNAPTKSDGSSKLNVEAYVLLDDLNNSENSDSNTWERSFFGMRFSVPIVFQ